jgi:hypothetical protein
MTEAGYGRVRPHVTVHSGMGSINPWVASVEVLRAVPGIGPRDAEAFVAGRAEAEEVSLEGLGPGRYFTDEEAGIVTVRAEAVLPSGASFCREAVIIPDGGGGGRGYRVLEWRAVRGDEDAGRSCFGPQGRGSGS